MLQAIKDKTRGWIAYVIIGVLAVPFAFFGVFNYFQPSSNPAVAEVNGTEIKRNELDRAVRQQRQQLQQRLGERYDPDRFDEDRLRRDALDQLIEQQALQSFTQRHDMTAPDGAVAQMIRSNSAFLVDGEFSQERYREVLQRNNMRVDEFEKRLRDDATVNQLRDAMASSAIVTQKALQRAAAVQYQRRHLAWLRVKADALSDEVTIGDEALTSYYQANKEAFRQPEEVRLAYIELSPDSLGASMEVSDAALRKRYEQVKDQRGEPERRRVEHIQLKLAEDAGTSDAESARQELSRIRQRIASDGLSFADAAREYSEDKLSAEQGGEIGMVAAGDLGGAFEDAVFQLEEGQLSDPVRTSQGMHLIRVSEVKPAQRPSFADLKDELRQAIIDERVAERIATQANKLKNLAYENPKTLEAAANTLGLEVRTTDWFSRRGTGEGLAANDEVVETAFSATVLEEGRNSELLSLGEDRRVILRVREKKPSRVPPLESVENAVRERLKAERLANLSEERGQALAERVRKEGVRFGSLADSAMVELNEYGWVGRQSRDEAPRQIIQTAFRMPAPAEGGPVLEGTRLPQGDYAVIALRGVQDGSLAGLTEEQQKQLAQALQRSSREASLGEFTSAVRQAADVTIHEGRL